MSTPFSTLGIDAGATLCKLALLRGEQIHTWQCASCDLDAARAQVATLRPDRIVATGGGAARLGAELAGVAVELEGEFDAWARGAPALAAQEGIALPARYLLVSLGTGTSILLLAGGKSERVGGSALGGGTLLGLGQLLLGTASFSEIAALAARGDRRSVDLLVGDIYEGSDIPLSRDLNASSFAKLASRKPEDIAHALTGLIGENLGLICAHLAQVHGATCVLYCGSTLTQNPALRAVLAGIGRMTSRSVAFLERGGFGGAIGAALKPDLRSRA
jgi:type II pantothenate kinase